MLHKLLSVYCMLQDISCARAARVPAARQPTTASVVAGPEPDSRRAAPALGPLTGLAGSLNLLLYQVQQLLEPIQLSSGYAILLLLRHHH